MKGVVITITESRRDHWFSEEDLPDANARRKYKYIHLFGSEALAATTNGHRREEEASGGRKAISWKGRSWSNTASLGRMPQGLKAAELQKDPR